MCACVCVQAYNAFQRFDLFNQHYNPFGLAELRNVFLKTDSYNKGVYFAELTKVRRGRVLFALLSLSPSLPRVCV